MSQNIKPQAGDRVRVVPEANVIVRDPATGAVVPPEGITVRHSSFWARRAAEGAVLLDLEPAKPHATPAQPPTA